MKKAFALAAILALASPVSAGPAQVSTRPAQVSARPAQVSARPAPVRARAVAKAAPVSAKPGAPKHDGAHARVAINHLGDLRPGREIIGRREEPLTAEEDTARQIEKLLRGPLRTGVTGLFVADARTGEALFAVNADDPLNPASNVKMISTATALELLGPDYRYPTRLLGQAPEAGVVHGDVYLLGSYDPTLSTADLDEIATAVAARGVTRIDGSIVVGADPTRDGLFRAVVPIDVRAGEPGMAPTASVPAGMDLVSLTVTAKTARTPARPRLTYQVETTRDGAGHPRVLVTIGGTIGKGGDARYALATRERTATAAYVLRAALRAHGVTLDGDFKTAELGDFVSDASVAAAIPVELGRHDSPRLAEIVAQVNKWSINWLADRVIVTAAALARRQPPSMELALGAMYDWLGRHPRIAKENLVVDTGSGLSYHTRITAHELVSIVRSAAGFGSGVSAASGAPGAAGAVAGAAGASVASGVAGVSSASGTDPGDAALARAWLDSLSIAGTDGTLSHRFRGGDVRGRIRGKTGTLSTAIALSGVLDVDPQRPLAFSLVTNGDTPLSKSYVRRAHEQVVALLVRYLARTQKSPIIAPALPVVTPLPAVPAVEPNHDLEELEPDPVLDAEPAPN